MHRTLLLTLGVVLAGAPAVATAMWVAPAADLSARIGSSYSPDVAVGPDGSATAVWARDAGGGVVTARASHRGGLSWDGDSALADGDLISLPVVVVDGTGIATAAWARWAGGNTLVEARRRTAAGWGPAEIIHSVPGSVAVGVQLAVDASGVVTAVYNDPTMGSGFAWFAQHSGGAWRTQLGIDAGMPHRFRLAGNAAGHVAVAWSHGGTAHLLQYDGATVFAPVPSSGPGASLPDVAIDADGNVTAVWARSGGGGTEVVWTRWPWQPLGANFPSATLLASAGTSPDAEPVVAVDPAGTVTAAWANSTLQVSLAARFTAGAWSAPVALGPSGDSDPALAVDPRGAVTAAWTGYDERGDAALRAARFTGAAWSDATTLGGSGARAGQVVDLAADAHGGVTAAWQSEYDAGSFLYEVQSQQFAGVPGPPTGAAAVAGDGTATVSWIPPSREGGAPITSYVVAASAGGDGCTVAAPATSCTVTGLTNGTGYRFTVRAISLAGTGEASGPTATVVPGAPMALLTAVLLPSRTRMVSGQSMRLGIRAVNAGTTPAASTRACVRLPAHLVSSRAPGAVRSGRTTCFPVGAIGPGASATRTMTVRAASTQAVAVRIAGRVSAPGAAAASAAPRTVRITPRHRAARVAG